MKITFLTLLVLLNFSTLARQVYVGYSDNTSERLGGLSVIKNYPLLQIAIVETEDESVLSGFDFVSAPPRKVEIDSKKSVSVREKEFSHSNFWNYKNINLAKAWEYTKGEGSKVLILDSGVDKNHPSLINRVEEIVDFTNSKVTQFVPYKGYDITGHGTHIAGVIGAKGPLLTGIAPETKLYIGKVCIFICRDQTILADAFEWAIQKQVDVISMSFSNTTYPEAIAQRIFSKLEEHNIVAVAASGNEGTGKNEIGFPAKYATVLSIGAINSDGVVASFSNHGPLLSLVAPGVDIISASLTKGINATDNLLRSMDGTSMATPHVSAVAALLRSLSPNFSPAQIREFILKGAAQTPFHDRHLYGEGSLDAAASLKLALEYLKSRESEAILQ